MKISIIMATYNSEKTIEKTFSSILNQTYKNYEIIIVDGKSNDSTCEIINNLNSDKVTKFISEKDFGVYDAFNKGLEYITGDWVFFLGSDDILSSEDIFEELKYFLNKNIDIIYTNVFIKKKLFTPYFDTRIILKNTIHHQGVLYNKNLFNTFRYDSSCRISADYELNLKCYINDAKSYYVDCILSICGDEGLSSKTSKIGYDEEIKIRNKYISSVFLKSILNSLTRLRMKIKQYLSIKGKNK